MAYLPQPPGAPIAPKRPSEAEPPRGRQRGDHPTLGDILLVKSYPLVNKHSYGKLPFIVDCSIKHSDVP